MILLLKTKTDGKTQLKCFTFLSLIKQLTDTNAPLLGSRGLISSC